MAPLLHTHATGDAELILDSSSRQRRPQEPPERRHSVAGSTQGSAKTLGPMAVLVLGLALAAAGCKGGSGDGGTSGGSGAPGAGGGGSGGGGGGGGGTAITVNADLAVLEATPLSTMLEAGESVSVALRVRNEGPDAIPSFRVGVYLSVDGTHDTTDELLSTFTSAGLAASADFQVSGLAQIPLATIPGDYRLIVFADDVRLFNEPNESNNTLSSAALLQIAAPTHPDFEMESVSFGPSSVQAGNTIDVSHAVRNVGVEASGSFRIGVYLSVDQEISSADLLIGQRSIASLAIGAADTANGAVTIPNFAPAGIYFVGALADDLGVVTEMDEFNNGLSAAATLSVSSAPLPDLTPIAAMAQSTVVDAGQPLVIEESVLNQGVTSASLFQVAAYLSIDADIDPTQDILLGTRSVPMLDAGQTSASGPQSVTVPGSTPGGTYFFGVVVDSGQFVAEASESNNSLVASGMVTVTIPPLPDLRVDAFSYGPSVVVSNGTSTLQITANIGNIGVESSIPVLATILLSPDSVVTLSDIALGSISVPAITPGGASGQNVSVPVPGGIASGSYRVGLWVDDADIQPEIDEGNNLLVAGGLLDVTGGGPSQPNLVSELIDPATMIAAPGTTFQTVTRVANIGDLSTPAFRVGVFLSTDSVIEPTDTRIGDRLVPFGLGGSFTSVASAPVTIPAAMPDGTYTIGVLADWQGNVVESDETDNALTRPGPFEVRTPPPPRPNLVISSISAAVGTTPSPGDVIDVEQTVANQGDLDAGPFRVGIYLSDDAIIDASDTLLATRVVAGLTLGGGSSSTTTAIQIPITTLTGTWFIGAWADDVDAVAESDETDNTEVDSTSFTL